MGTKHIGYYTGFRESHLGARAEKKVLIIYTGLGKVGKRNQTPQK